MKVKDLIELLQAQDKEKSVEVFCRRDDTYVLIDSVEAQTRNKEDDDETDEKTVEIIAIVEDY